MEIILIEPNETDIKTLKEIGFPKDSIRTVLIRIRNNINSVIDI